jgi:hypothetical protein
MPEKDRHNVAGRHRNRPRKAVQDVGPVFVEIGLRRGTVLKLRMGVEFEFDPLRHADTDAVMCRLERQAYAAEREALIPKVEAHQLDIVR